jgi:hypothetical protein
LHNSKLGLSDLVLFSQKRIKQEKMMNLGHTRSFLHGTAIDKTRKEMESGKKKRDPLLQKHF